MDFEYKPSSLHFNEVPELAMDSGIRISPSRFGKESISPLYSNFGDESFNNNNFSSFKSSMDSSFGFPSEKVLNNDEVRLPYVCELCGQAFKKKKNLEAHHKIHKGEKPYSCHLCGKGFHWSGSLRRHLRIHTGEKPFTCKICSKSFTQSGTLNRHIRTHDRPNVPYHTCRYCSGQFSCAMDLQVHLTSNCPVVMKMEPQIQPQKKTSRRTQKVLFSQSGRQTPRKNRFGSRRMPQQHSNGIKYARPAKEFNSPQHYRGQTLCNWCNKECHTEEAFARHFQQHLNSNSFDNNSFGNSGGGSQLLSEVFDWNSNGDYF